MANQELSRIETIAIGVLAQDAAKLQQANKQFTDNVLVVVAEIEKAHSGYTLDQTTLKLIEKPALAPEE